MEPPRESDPRWHAALVTLERLALRCEDRRAALERDARAARTASGVATVAATAVVIVLESVGGVSITSLTPRCQAPAGPTVTLPGAGQASGIPCGGMAAAGGAGPIVQRGISTTVTAAERTGAMRVALDAAYEWLDTNQALAEWSSDDEAEWSDREARVRALCIE